MDCSREWSTVAALRSMRDLCVGYVTRLSHLSPWSAFVRVWVAADGGWIEGLGSERRARGQPHSPRIADACCAHCTARRSRSTSICSAWVRDSSGEVPPPRASAWFERERPARAIAVPCASASSATERLATRGGGARGLCACTPFTMTPGTVKTDPGARSMGGRATDESECSAIPARRGGRRSITCSGQRVERQVVVRGCGWCGAHRWTSATGRHALAKACQVQVWGGVNGRSGAGNVGWIRLLGRRHSLVRDRHQRRRREIEVHAAAAVEQPAQGAGGEQPVDLCARLRAVARIR